METKHKKTKVVVGVLALAAVLLFSLFAMAGSLEPGGPPGPTMKTLDEIEPRIPVQSLAANAISLHVIDEPGSYYLTDNITGMPARNGIEIASDDVTLDLNGFALMGVQQSLDGITSVGSHYNIAVLNGAICKWGGDGLDATNLENSQFANLRVYENGGTGLGASKGSTVDQCTARDNGIIGIGTNAATATNCTTYSNSGYGILADNGSTVVNCIARSNGGVGIGISNGGGTARGCTARFNGGDGISGATGCTISDCTAEFNTGHGFALASGASVEGCTARSNSINGIQIGKRCLVQNNTITGNGSGIHVSGAVGNEDNRIESNLICDNNVGLDIDTKGNYVADNTVKGNTDNYDIGAGNQLNILLCEVPETIDWPAMVTLAGTLTSTAADQNGITVNADDVTIDLGGHSLIGPDSGTNYGIYMNGQKNVEVRNGTVRDFFYGIYESNFSGQDHRVVDVRSVSNGRRGIYLNGYSHLVKDCTASGNGYSATSSVYGIFAGSGSTVTGNTAGNNGDLAGGTVYGIFAYSGSTLTGNTAGNNGDLATGNVYGISADNGSTVTGNTAYSNGTSAKGAYVRGIQAFNSCTVIGNTVVDNGDSATGDVYGIWLAGSSLVDQNTAVSNGTGAGGMAINMNTGLGGITFGLNHTP